MAGPTCCSSSQTPLPLDPLFREYDLEDDYLTATLRASRCKGSYYAWPLSVHRLNTMLVNTKVYQRYRDHAEAIGETLPPDLRELKSAEDLIVLLEKMKDWSLEGDDVELFAMGTRRTDENDSGTVEDQSWVMLVLAFENLLVWYGNGLYEQIWQGAGTRTDDELGPSLRQLTQQLRRLGKLMGSVQQSWQQAAAKVGNGDALRPSGAIGFARRRQAWTRLTRSHSRAPTTPSYSRQTASRRPTGWIGTGAPPMRGFTTSSTIPIPKWSLPTANTPFPRPRPRGTARLGVPESVVRSVHGVPTPRERLSPPSRRVGPESRSFSRCVHGSSGSRHRASRRRRAG